MKLDELSLKERLVLCFRAEGLCAERFREVEGHVSRGEEALRSALLNLAEDEEHHGDRVREYYDKTPWPVVWHLSEAHIVRLLRENFPTLMQPPEGDVTRDQALQFVATVEDESERFYRSMAAGAPDETARRFFEQVAAAEAVHRDALFGAAT